MNLRQQINLKQHQQAVRFSENFANDEVRQEFLAELTQRQTFEQTQLSQDYLQNIVQKLPLVKVSILILLSILSIGSLFYWQTDRYTQVVSAIQAHQQHQQQMVNESVIERNDRYIVHLQNQLREAPNNGDLWFELGQAYMLNNDFHSASICYHNAQKVLGKRPAILGAMATADYYDKKQILSEQAQNWIEQALNQDPQESSSLLLLASDAFLNNDFSLAVSYWRKVLESENRAVDRRAIIESIRLAEQLSAR